MDSNITTELVASSSSPSTNSWKYDVFLSFSGQDTRKMFADHLHHSLLRRGINTFMDPDQLGKGEIYQPIKDSRISVIIFSKNYASSTWCLEELAKIIECKNSQDQIVIPVFYDVDPTDVKEQRGSFAEAFHRHEKRFKENLEMVERWRAALTDAANLPGMVLYNYEYESKFIHEITEMISQKLDRAYLTYETNHPVEIDSRIQEMNDLLGVGVADVRMVGICGTGGMGKTTLAKAVFNSVAHNFEGSCFLENVREKSKAPGGLGQLQKILLDNILGLKMSSVTNVGSGINVIKDSLRKKKVLIVLDDVDQLDQLKYLAGSSDWFGAGSRIIITTRDEHVLRAHGVDFTYQVKELESDEALELFSSNAFPTSRLPDDYQVLARRFVGYAQGNPLALTAMGSLLCGKSIVQWHSILESYERAPASNIHEILKITKRELEHQVKRPEENVLTNVEEHAGVHDLQSTGLNEVENTEKLLGVETFSGTQEEERIQGNINRTDDVTEQNEDENNVNLVEGDKTFSGIQEEDLLGKTPGTDDALNKVENTEKFVEGDKIFSNTQEEVRLEGKIQGTGYITEQNEDENNVNLVEGDKTFSSIQEEDLLGKAPGTDDALNKVENTEKLVEGDQTFSSTQALQTLQGRIPNTEAVTGVNATEGTERFPGRDETSSDTKKLEKLRNKIDDVTEPKPKANEGVVENTCWSTTIKSFLLEAATAEWIFLIISFFLEILAAICDQFFSPGNPQFALTGMWLASVALCFCICELILKCKNGESSSPRLEMFPDIFGLICGISQWLSTIARFVCMLKGMENPFKVNILPVIFLGCLGSRKLIANNKRCKTENRIELTSIVHVPNNGPTPDEAQAKKGS